MFWNEYANNLPNFYIFSFHKIFISSFWDFSTIKCDEKTSFDPISFKLGSAYVSEDSKKTKKIPEQNFS